MDIFNKRWLTVWLYPFSLLFRLAVFFRNFLYDHNLLRCVKLSVPVISVGNLTVGGSGKTPAVEYLARLLLSHQLRPAIITRGYGRRIQGTVVVADGRQIRCAVDASGDEAMQLAKRLPPAVIIADERKFRGALFACKNFQIDAVIVDDGFQHRRLHRDIDLVLIDAPSFSENRWLLPAGPFREPWSALRRADAVIFTNANEATAGEMEARRALRRANFSALLFSAALESKFFENLTSGEAAPISFLQGKKVFAACGIARPGRFFEELKKLGMNLVGHAAFPDHHLFKKDQITNLLLRARAATADAVVLTEKDAPKWMAVISEPALPVFLLRMEFRVTADADLLTAKILRSCRSAAHDAAANL